MNAVVSSTLGRSESVCEPIIVAMMAQQPRKPSLLLTSCQEHRLMRSPLAMVKPRDCNYMLAQTGVTYPCMEQLYMECSECIRGSYVANPRARSAAGKLVRAHQDLQIDLACRKSTAVGSPHTPQYTAETRHTKKHFQILGNGVCCITEQKMRRLKCVQQLLR